MMSTIPSESSRVFTNRNMPLRVGLATTPQN